MTECHVSITGPGRAEGTIKLASTLESMPDTLRALVEATNSLSIIEIDEHHALLGIRASLTMKGGRIKAAYAAESDTQTVLTAECRIPAGIVGASDERARLRVTELLEAVASTTETTSGLAGRDLFRTQPKRLRDGVSRQTDQTPLTPRIR